MYWVRNRTNQIRNRTNLIDRYSFNLTLRTRRTIFNLALRTDHCLIEEILKELTFKYKMSTMLERRKRKRRLILDSDSDDDSWEPMPSLDLNMVNNRSAADRIDDPELYRAMEEVKQEISKTEPNIFNILKEPMTIQDRAELFQLYELYKMMEFSEEQIALKKKIYTKYNQAIVKFQHHNEYSTKERKQFETELSYLETFDEWKEMKYTILSLNTVRDNKQVIYGAYKRLSLLSETDDEYHKLRHWLKWATSLPYDNLKTFPYTKNKITTFLQQVSERLNRELYGMHSVKEQILVFLNVRIQNPKIKKCTLGLVGAPGTGKSYISRLLADVIDFPFEQISFGGVSDPNFLKGHSSTYIGAEPGEIVRRMSKMKYKNGIMFFDEFNRISKELCAALLHIIDPTQNTEFRDNFLAGLKLDLSHIWFILSMNDPPEDSALRDRTYLIEVPEYNKDDKICILRDYQLPRALKNLGMEPNSVKMSTDTAKYIVDLISPTESGVRSLDSAAISIVNKLSFLKNHQDRHGKLPGFSMSFGQSKKLKFPLSITKSMVNSLLLQSPQFTSNEQ